jgi:hypothetical protein
VFLLDTLSERRASLLHTGMWMYIIKALASRRRLVEFVLYVDRRIYGCIAIHAGLVEGWRTSRVVHYSE